MKAELTFEKALARLEQIVAQLDAGDLPLEKPSSHLMKAGTGKVCSSVLDQAEGHRDAHRGKRRQSASGACPGRAGQARGGGSD